MSGVAAEFRRLFGREPEGVWTAPGRINLIGEHTDYNDGFALPIALPHSLDVAAARRPDGVVRLSSRQFPDVFEAPLADLVPASVPGWAAYQAGTLWALLDEGYPVSGMDLLVDSAIPTGTGLSTSAAVCCATVLAATGLHGCAPAPAEVARLAQRSENDFVGMPCGIMDQSAVMLSDRGRALFLDCRSLAAEQVPFDPAAHGMSLLVVDTRAPRRLVEGAYAQRRRSCEEAARILGVRALRDVSPEELPGALAALPDDLVRRRVRHVVTENARVLETVDLFREGRPRAAGPLFTASHASLRDDFEVSVPEVDTAVEAALSAGALGARITGGGFGGCVIALVESGLVAECGRAVRAAFAERGFGEPVVFTALPSAGARRLS
ncbi:galactokinase [Nocardiopsis terrae]|uniref:Galactokinase n=1 Tax=Nocardiopsis terrae TaxID=372655 RepID=A0ABR9HN18_9ACTN|nr:galactokinase [Nocardiopsis terrae]MBE1460379.1 galactokinase [Nocardiopsis terrae]GHC71141.1 galactokinase [Nocardiopsis terrae]